MRSRDQRSSNYFGDHRGGNGRLGTCNYCGDTIYWAQNWNGNWVPFESTAAGNADRGEMEFHQCSARRRYRDDE